MANDTSSAVWVLDSVGQVLSSPLINLQGIRWVGATTAGHQCVLKDKNGKVIWASVANAANYVEADAPTLRSVEGLTVATLDSGVVYVET